MYTIDLVDVALTAQIRGMTVIRTLLVLPMEIPLGNGNNIVNRYTEYTISKRSMNDIRPRSTANLMTRRCGLIACCATM